MKIRPQILAAILILGLIAILALVGGYTEVTTACVGGIIGLGNNLLEAKQ